MDEIILESKNGKVVVSSRDIAEKFNKRHDHVLRDVDSFKKDVPNFGEMYFETEVPDRYGRMQRCFDINRDGFSLLAMGFTGKKALEWKLKYIEAFNKMEETLKSGNLISEEEKLKLKLFSKDPMEVAMAHNQLVELATAPLIAENKELKPKAEFHDAIATAENCVNFGDFSGTFQNNSGVSFGRNKIMEWCRNKDYLCSSYNLKNKPSQQMINSGYMKYKENVKEQNGKKYITYTPLLTGKGTIWLTKKLSEFLNK